MSRTLPADAVRRLVLFGCLLAGVLGIFGLAEEVSALAGAPTARPLLLLVATALVAGLVPAGRPWAERLADRAAYGRNGDPYAAVTRFVSRIADTLAVDDVLPRLAHAASQAMHGERSDVRLWLADGGEWRQTWPPGGEAAALPLAVPLQHGGHAVGRLGLDVADDDLSPPDRELLSRLVGPAGLALANVQLTFELRRQLARATALAEDLARSRERLLQAGSEQRQRFASTVQDRVQSRLAAADAALAAGTVQAAAEARAEVLAALEALRSIAAGVFPPALDDSGLAAALELYLDRRPEPVTLRVDGLPAGSLPSQVAAAAYFSCVSLLDDLLDDFGGETARGSAAPPATVRLDGDDREVVIDLGAGSLPAPETLQLVQDRVAAVGGTVTPGSGGVLVRIPAHGEGEE